MQLSNVPRSSSSQPTPPAELPARPVVRSLAQQALLFAGGVATFAGLYEFAAPLITWATSGDPTYVIPARAGAAAAVGAFGGQAAVMMESAYDTVTAAAVATKRDPELTFRDALGESTHEQKRVLPGEMWRAAGSSATAGAALGVLASFFPDATIWLSVTAVGGALAYGLTMLGIRGVRASKAFHRADDHAARGETEPAHEARVAGHEHLRLAGRAALEALTVAAVTHHVIGEAGQIVGNTFGHDHAKASKIAASTAEQLPGAVEAFAEVAEAVSVGMREARMSAPVPSRERSRES